MKTEDIDKRIGMPDVDKEWARFEQEVIGKEAKAGKNLWLWGLSIAASIIIVAGLFFLNHDSRETEQLLKETSKHSISHEVVSEPSSSEKPAELIAKTSQPKKIKENWKGSTVTDNIYVSTATYNTFDCDEENAVFPGGEEALLAFIKANLKLPNLAIEYGAKGRIFTSFVIDSVGEVSDIRILERPQARISYDTPRLSQEPEDTQVKIKDLIALQLGEEATRILSLMPRWRPAIWGGKPTKTRYHLPIIFDATKAEQQKFLAKNLASESVDQALQEQIAGLDIVPNSSYLGNGTTMRLRGLGDSVIDQIGKTDSFLVVVNGKTLFDSRGMTSEEIERRIEEYLNEQGLLQNIKIPCNNGAIVIMASTPEEREELQRMIANATIVPTSADLGSGTTMRLRGTGSGPSDKDRIDSTLILVNGEPLPDSLKWQVLGKSPDDVDTNMPRYFSRQGLLIDSVYVHKDSEFTAKYGWRAKYGVIEIKTVPDTYCDAYVRKHPKLKKKYQRVEGYVFDNNGKPLTEAYVHIERDFIGAATDSTGHFVFWVPRKDVTLRAEQPGYKTYEFSPTDKNLVMHLEKSYNGYNMRLRGNSQEQIAGLPKYVPDENEVRLLPLGAIGGSHDSPPNDSILYLVNGVPQPKENNKWLDKRSYLDYLKGQHLLVSKVMRHMNEEAKQRYIEKYGEAAKHGVIEYICVEDTLCDYYMDQHEELKASRRRVSGIVYDENDEPLAHTMIYIWHDKRVWGFETTDSLGNFTFWVPRTDVKMEFTYVGFYKAVVVEPSDTFQTIYLLPNDNLKSLKESLKF
ncbi:MAG: carboxypeptidase-like regulatory domain-containing protein [Bacteroidaceae bacterium]|nr:carboxypeptidase-like regulatory domain-containing protein [Bacteroidaceae bacterium]